MATQTSRKGVLQRNENPILAYLSLFTSFGTLVCCALPSLLVLIGLGSTVAWVLSAAPWLVTLARHRMIVFIISGVLIASDFVYVYGLAPRLKVRSEGCSIEKGRNACATATRISRVALWTAAVIYAIGFFTAFLLAPILFG